MQTRCTRNRFRVTVSLAFSLLLTCILLTACGSSSDDDPPLIIGTDAELPLLGIDQSIQLEAIASSGNMQTIVTDDVPWTSSDESVIMMSGSGLATSTGFGMAQITTEFEANLAAIVLDVVPAYFLPLSPGRYEMVQGFNGSFSHFGTFTYSYDFIMTIGTLLIAARAGTVHAVEDSFPDSTGLFAHTNFVVIDHHDGTFSRYLHLTPNGAFVDVGEQIEVGDTIGVSGNSGFSTRPHLHFDVTMGCGVPLELCQTIEFWLANGPARQIRSGSVVQVDE